LTLTVVRDLRDARAVAGPDELDAFETDVLAGFVLARAAAGLSDGTISSDVIHLEQVRAWFGRPLWDMEPPDADEYFGRVLPGVAKGAAVAGAGAEDVLPVPGTAAHGGDPPDDRPCRRVPDRRDEPAPGPPAGQAADPAVGRAGRPAVHRLARGAGDLQEVRPRRPQLHGLQADGRRRPAGQRRRAGWTWPTSSGTWAGSASSTSGTARAPAAPAPTSGWSP
jgi:hypothetical protein